MRGADRYVAWVSQASDDFSSKVGTAQARVAATQWKLEQGTAAYITASGENPGLNAVDLVVIATVSRMIVEAAWVGGEFGEAARPLLETHRLLESNSWSLVAGVLTPEQHRDLRARLERWRMENPGLRVIGVARATDFIEHALTFNSDSGGLGLTSLLDVIGLDPLYRLDPAIRSLEQTRYLAERTIYYAERLPKLLSWQAELFVFRMANEPEFKQIMSNANRLTRSTEIFSQTAEQIPKLVNDQREAAINQIFAGLLSEESKVRDLLAETRATLGAGREMADSVNAAINSLNAFNRTVNPVDTNAPATSTNRVPFNIRDYGNAANQISVMARDLETLLTSANQSAPQAAQLSQQARTDAKQVLNHAFRLGVLLILILAGALMVAGLIYRVLADRLTRNRRV
jgi:hypothetical protein